MICLGHKLNLNFLRTLRPNLLWASVPALTGKIFLQHIALKYIEDKAVD